MPLSVAYPPPPPSVTGETISVSAYLQNPTRVTRIVQALAAQRFVADLIFGPGPAVTGGAVQYDQIDRNDLFLDRDVEAIRPGAEYPILSDTAPAPKMAAVTKWGGRVFVTDENRDRNRYDVLNRELTKLANTIIRKVDTVAIAALDAAPIRSIASAFTWSAGTGEQIVGQLVDARVLVDDADMGYVVDTVLVNPAGEAALLKKKEFRDALQGSQTSAILRDATVGRVLTMDFFKTNRVPAGTAYVLQRRIVGGISDEAPLATKTYRQEDSDKTWVQGARRLVPYVTDPLAVVKITGI